MLKLWRMQLPGGEVERCPAALCAQFFVELAKVDCELNVSNAALCTDGSLCVSFLKKGRVLHEPKSFFTS